MGSKVLHMGSERAHGDGCREVRDGRVAAVLATAGARHAHGRETSRQAVPEQHEMMVLRYVPGCHGVHTTSASAALRPTGAIFAISVNVSFLIAFQPAWALAIQKAQARLRIVSTVSTADLSAA